MLSTLKKPAEAPLPRDLEKLFEDYGRFVLGVAYRVTGNWTAAEDILQALFLRLLQSDRIGALESNPKGYLYRAAVNMSLDVIRRERLDPSGDAIEQYRIMAADQVREYESAEIQESFRIGLSKLSPKAAEMFILNISKDTKTMKSHRCSARHAELLPLLCSARARFSKNPCAGFLALIWERNDETQCNRIRRHSRPRCQGNPKHVRHSRKGRGQFRSNKIGPAGREW